MLLSIPIGKWHSTIDADSDTIPRLSIPIAIPSGDYQYRLAQPSLLSIPTGPTITTIDTRRPNHHYHRYRQIQVDTQPYPGPRPPTPDPRPPTPDPRPPTPDPRPPTPDPRPPTTDHRPPTPDPRPPTPDPRPPTPDPRPPTPDPRPPTPDPGTDLATLEGHASKQQPIHLSKHNICSVHGRAIIILVLVLLFIQRATCTSTLYRRYPYLQYVLARTVPHLRASSFNLPTCRYPTYPTVPSCAGSYLPARPSPTWARHPAGLPAGALAKLHIVRNIKYLREVRGQ